MRGRFRGSAAAVAALSRGGLCYRNPLCAGRSLPRPQFRPPVLRGRFVLGSFRIGLARGAAGWQRLEIGGYVRRPITNEPADADERNAASCNPILLQRGASASGYPLNVTVGEQLIEHVAPHRDTR